MKFSISALFVLSILFVSCSGNSQEETPANDSLPAVNDSANVGVSVSLPDSAATPLTATTGSEVKLNPPHGEPGHRCEIEVGKPLPADGKSAPATVTPAPATVSAPTISTPATPAPSAKPVTISTGPGAAPGTSSVTAPGMNPPHGEPGHDCAIPVGAPLKK